MAIVAGTYTAKIVDYTLRKTQAGEPEPMIRFAFNGWEWNWRGSLKEGKARDITLKALVTCGFEGDENDLARLANGVSTGILSTTKEVQVVVSMETGKDGKEYPKIDWVNEIGAGGSFKDKLTESEAKTKFANMNLAADLKRLIPVKKSFQPAIELDMPF